MLRCIGDADGSIYFSLLNLGELNMKANNTYHRDKTCRHEVEDARNSAASSFTANTVVVLSWYRRSVADKYLIISNMC